MRGIAGALALLLAVAGCRQAPPNDADPALWAVRDADTTVYLFGSVHVLKPGLSWFDEAVRAAFDASDTLVLELVLPDTRTMQALASELGTAQNAPPLSGQLSPERRARLAQLLAEARMPADALDRFEPWFAATTLGALAARRSGYDDAHGVETVLTDAAKTAGKPILGLETPREQLGFFDTLAPETQAAMLRAAIDDAPRAGAELDAMVAAWSRGDVATLAARTRDELAAAPELERRLLVERNRAFADWVARRLARPGTVFVAVGAGHLAGPASVQAELARRGLTAERLAY